MTKEELKAAIRKGVCSSEFFPVLYVGEMDFHSG